jgi:hypothetical protein
MTGNAPMRATEVLRKTGNSVASGCDPRADDRNAVRRARRMISQFGKAYWFSLNSVSHQSAGCHDFGNWI